MYGSLSTSELMFWYQPVGVNVAIVPISVDTRSGPLPFDAARLYFCTIWASGTSVSWSFILGWEALNDLTSGGRNPASSARAHIVSVTGLFVLLLLALDPHAAVSPTMPRTDEAALTSFHQRMCLISSLLRWRNIYGDVPVADFPQISVRGPAQMIRGRSRS